jgi:hypothetical protein
MSAHAIQYFEIFLLVHVAGAASVTISHAYYINAAHSTSRRSFSENWLSKDPMIKNIYRRVNAVIPHLAPHAPDTRCARGHRHPLRCRGTVGAILSNLHIINDLNTSGNTLVLEDDFSMNVSEAMEAMKNVPPDWQIVRFNCKRRSGMDIPSSFQKMGNVFRTADFGTCRSTHTCPWFCGGAYSMLWREGSTTLLKQLWSKQPYRPHDCRLTTHKIVSYCVDGITEHWCKRSTCVTLIPKL